MGHGGCGWVVAVVWVVVVVCGSWRLWVGCGGCVWVMAVVAVVGGSWRLCVGHGGCVWVVAVVWESWLCVGHGGCGWVMVCESREVSKDAIMCQVPTASDIQG